MALKLFIVTIISLALLWAWRNLHNPKLMPIRHVNLVATYQHLDQKTLINTVNPYVATGLLTVDVAGLKNALLQQPWINQVVVKRIWPDQLEIDITEQQAVATWNKTNLMNAATDIFAPPMKSFPTGLPQLQGPDGQAANVWQHWQQYSQLFASLQLTITSLQLNSRGSWQLILSNGIKLILGRADSDKRLKRLLAVYSQTLAPKAANIASIDLRYIDGFAVQWRNGNATIKSTNKNPRSSTPSQPAA